MAATTRATSTRKAAPTTKAAAKTGAVGRARRGGRPLGRPIASDGDGRRRRIIEVARQEFAKSGYVGTTNREIAEQAGITTGAIYHYFASKLDLYLAVFEETDERILERYDEVVGQGSMSFSERIAALLEVSSQMNSEDQTLASFLAMASFEAHRTPELMPSYREHDRKMTRFFGDLVDHGIAEGALDAAAGRQDILDVIRVLTLGLTWFAVRIQDPEAHRRATHATVRMVRGQLVGAPVVRRRRAAK